MGLAERGPRSSPRVAKPPLGGIVAVSSTEPLKPMSAPSEAALPLAKRGVGAAEPKPGLTKTQRYVKARRAVLGGPKVA